MLEIQKIPFIVSVFSKPVQLFFSSQQKAPSIFRHSRGKSPTLFGARFLNFSTAGRGARFFVSHFLSWWGEASAEKSLQQWGRVPSVLFLQNEGPEIPLYHQKRRGARFFLFSQRDWAPAFRFSTTVRSPHDPTMHSILCLQTWVRAGVSSPLSSIPTSHSSFPPLAARSPLSQPIPFSRSPSTPLGARSPISQLVALSHSP